MDGPSSTSLFLHRSISRRAETLVIIAPPLGTFGVYPQYRVLSEVQVCCIDPSHDHLSTDHLFSRESVIPVIRSNESKGSQNESYPKESVKIGFAHLSV